MAQHILETDQRFTPAARRAVREHTRDQPWLVNALYAGTCFKSETGRDRSRAIGVEGINTTPGGAEAGGARGETSRM